MTQNINLFQGSSATATPIKQYGLRGIYKTVAMMRSGDRFPAVVFVDLYCGSGENILPGEIIAGSPISMLAGILDSLRGKGSLTKAPKGQWLIVFNDIAPGRATVLLPENVMRWQAENGLQVDRDALRVTARDGKEVVIPIKYITASAASVLDEITETLDAYKNAQVVMTIDPNGPKDAPWEKLRDVWHKYSQRAELVFHLAATHMKRVAKARNTCGIGFFAPMPDHINALIQSIIGCGGWVREPVGADQWTLLWLTKFPPRNDWKTATPFHKIETECGQAVIRRLSLTKKELELAA